MGLGVCRLEPRVIGVIHRQVQLVLLTLVIAAVLGPAIREHPQQPDAMGLVDAKRPIVEQVCRRNRRTPVV